MTDEQIIKALECCYSSCSYECPYFGDDDFCMFKMQQQAVDLINRQKAEIISRTEEYNDMLEQRNKVEEVLEVMTMDVNSLTNERDALNEMVVEQKAELCKKDTEIDILIRKKETLNDEIAELKAEVERLEFDNVHWNDWEVKCRAVTEFAERLKDLSTERLLYEGYGETKLENIILCTDIDNLVKEMTEGEKQQ